MTFSKSFLFISFFVSFLCLVSGCNEITDTQSTTHATPETSPETPETSIPQIDSIPPTPGAPAPPKQVEGKLYLVDEGGESNDFIKFRIKLMNALQERDLEFLMATIDDNMKVDFGGSEGGPAGFKKMWQLDENPRRSEIWKVLYKTLSMGGIFDNKEKTEFTTNYVFTSLPIKYDAFTHAVITGSNVRMRSQPGLKSKTIGVLDHDIVEYLQDQPTETETIDGETFPWVKVKHPKTKQIGYVFGKFVESPIGMRARFVKKGNDWKMVTLVAGD